MALIDDGAELFGVGTPLVLEGRNAPQRLRGLAQYDSRQLGGNDDGHITRSGCHLAAAAHLVDVNADGVSTRDEMRTLRSAGLTALETIPKIRKYVDAAGNVIPYWAWASNGPSPAVRSWSTCSSVVLPLRSYERLRSRTHLRTSATRDSTLSFRNTWRTCDLTVFAETPRSLRNLRERPPFAQQLGHRLFGGSQTVCAAGECSTQVMTKGSAVSVAPCRRNASP